MANRRRKILLTGVTSGIGRALAHRLCERHDVIGTGRRDGRDVALPAHVTYVQADLSDPKSATQIIASALLEKGWTQLDNAILNAGTGFATADGVDDIARARQTLAVNLTAPIMLCRALYPWLLKANGTVSLIGSVAHKGQGLFPSYAASKAGLDGFARALRSEWDGRISVQVIHPGPTQTDMHAKAGHDPGRLRRVFVPVDAAAQMIEGCIAARRSPITVSLGRYWTGGTLRARRLT